mgnify:CR=1 FL=1
MAKASEKLTVFGEKGIEVNSSDWKYAHYLYAMIITEQERSRSDGSMNPSSTRALVTSTTGWLPSFLPRGMRATLLI